MDDLLTMVTDSACAVFADHCTPALRRKAAQGNWPADLWAAMVDIGLPYALVREERGGAGLSVEQGFLLLKVAGRYAVPLPLAETMLAAWLLDSVGLPLPNGPLSLGAALADAPRLSRETGEWRLTGTLSRVPWGRDAAAVVLVASTGDGACLVAVDPAVARCDAGTNMAGEPRDTLHFQAAAVLGCAPAILSADQVRATAAVARAAQIAGACEHALALSRDYANLRVQFGRPIAKFQAIQHSLAMLASQLAAASAAADGGIEAVSRDFNLAAIASAKVRAGESAGSVAAIAHQVFGAIGFTQEHELHFTTKRLWSWREEFGDESHWAERLGRHLFAMGGSRLWAEMTH